MAASTQVILVQKRLAADQLLIKRYRHGGVFSSQQQRLNHVLKSVSANRSAILSERERGGERDSNSSFEEMISYDV